MVDLRIPPAELSEPFLKIKPAPWYFADKIAGCGKHLADFLTEGQSLSGVILWFANINDVCRWGDSQEELIHQYPDSKPKSVTFIASSVFGNRILLEKDPGYLANLQAQSLEQQMRLFKGNWKFRSEGGLIKRKRLTPRVCEAKLRL